jgi:nucleotide-binding universal stress UspA family protein
MPVLEEPATVSIKNLLLATDFSRASEKALAYATAMAARFSSSVEVAYVLNPSVVTTYEEAILGIPFPGREQMYHARLGDVCHTLTRQGVAAHPHLSLSHDAPNALLKLALENEVELILVGTQSKTGVERLVLGSTAEHLIRRATCPVLTVGPDAPWPAPGPMVFRNIVFATDLSPQAMKALPYALSFAEDSGAHLHLCMVMAEQAISEYQRDLLKEGFRVAMMSMIPERAFDWCTPDCIVEHGDAAKSILAVAERVKADLIVLGARQASFWLSHIDRGLTPDIIASATCPVMTIC